MTGERVGSLTMLALAVMSTTAWADITQIDVPGATSTFANGINDAGQIVGSFSNSTGTHGLLDMGGSFTQIGAPGDSRRAAYP